MSSESSELTDEALAAVAGGDLGRAEQLYVRALARVDPSDTEELWFVQGRYADLLLKLGRKAEAKELLESSLRVGTDLPASMWPLLEIYLEEEDWQSAEGMLRSIHRRDLEWAAGAGRERPTPDLQILTLAKAGPGADASEPIERAARWADEVHRRDLFLAVGHQRGLLLERTDVTAAIGEYARLIDAGSAHEPTFVRMMVLLPRQKRYLQAVAVAEKALTIGASARLEQSARKKLQSLAARVQPREPVGGPVRAGKQVLPPFVLRRGGDYLTWCGPVAVKGTAKTVWADRAGDTFVLTTGAGAALWRLDADLSVSKVPLAVSSPSSLLLTGGRALVTRRGRVAQGSSLIQMLGPDWSITRSYELPAIHTEIAQCSWGLAAGCRNGALYALNWGGELRWTYRVSEVEGASPWFVRASHAHERVVLSSWSDVRCLERDGFVAWSWGAPQGRSVVKEEGFTITMEISGANNVRALDATRDGGAFILASGVITRLDGKGKIMHTIEAPEQAGMVISREDELLAITSFDGLRFVDSNGRPIATFVHPRWISPVWSDERQLLAAYSDRSLWIFGRKGQLRAEVEFTGNITDVAWSTAGLLVAAGKLAALELADRTAEDRE